MIDLSMTFEKMKEKINFTHYEIDKKIIPRYEKNFLMERWGKELPSHYFISNLGEKLFGFNENRYKWIIVNDIFLNAIERGNKDNLELPIFVKLALGKNGAALQVKDSGEGFNLEEKLMQMKNGEKYYQRKGIGLKLFFETEKIISYEGKNNIINILG